MVGTEKKQIFKITRNIEDTALSYSKIRPFISLENNVIIVHIPTIRLESVEAQNVEVIIYNDGRVIKKINWKFMEMN